MKNASPTSDRETRIAGVGYDYAAQPKRAVTACNLCGGHLFVVLAHRDRYGFAAPAHGCRRCGLVFLNPVMTAPAYAQFYIDVYRPLVSAYHGRLIDARSIQAEQYEYGAARAELLRPYLSDRRGGRLLDIGGSTGVVAHVLCREFGLHGTVIDPSPLEIEEARRLGLDTVTGLAEDWDGGAQRFDVAVICQTVDHLLDVRATLAAVRRLLSPDAIVFIDIVDFRAAYLRNGAVHAAIKIDHPYYFTEPTIEAALARAGLAIARVEYAADQLHVGYVCTPAAPREDALPDAREVAAMWREIRALENAPR